MVKKKGVGIPCHFSKVCIFDLISLFTNKSCDFRNPKGKAKNVIDATSAVQM
jgi:hypothetical protein